MAVKMNYRGRVQGVGFRYRTQQIAERFQVNGYVKNLADGSVELVAEGQDQEVEAFLQEVALAHTAHILQARREKVRATGYRGFVIQRC